MQCPTEALQSNFFRHFDDKNLFVEWNEEKKRIAKGIRKMINVHVSRLPIITIKSK